MGFLDHSTNNIIVDAVLTDTGREFLAANRGDFRIAYFSLSDDEVDYTIIERFGRSVGKEKIIKNTPIFEAQTIGSIAQKHRMVSLPDPTIVRLPTITLKNHTVDATTGMLDAVELHTSDVGAGNTHTAITIEQQITGNQRVPDGLSDTSFTIEMVDRFLTIQGTPPFNIEAGSRIASYTKAAGVPTNANGATVSFTLHVQGGLGDDMFQQHARAGSPDTIATVVSVIGDQSGYRLDFTVHVSRA